MRLRKWGSVAALSAGVLLLGGMNAKAETNYQAWKGDVEKNKAHAPVQKVDGFEQSKLKELLKSRTTKGLLQSLPERKGYTTQALTGNYLYEVEPNDLVEDANYLPQGDMVYGTFTENDIDTYAIELSQPSTIAVSGIMETTSLSDIGFVLTDENDNIIEEDADQFDDHQMTAGYNLDAGVYYVRAINMGEYITDDVYGLAWDTLDQQDTTPPAAPAVDRVDDNDTVITGSAEPGSSIEISLNGSIAGTDVTKDDGRFSVSIPAAFPSGSLLNVTAIDQAGNRSTITTVYVTKAIFTSWVKEGNKYYHYTNGVKDKGWYRDTGRWFFLDKKTGEKKIGWVLDGGKWYYLDAYGVMKTGWVKLGPTWYYLASSGAMKTGWLKDGANWYYLASSGAMKTGWVKVGTKWYYLYSSGKMAYSTKINGYRLGADGAWITK